MLLNGLTIDGKKNVVLGTTSDICYSCLMEELSKEENRDKSPDEVKKQVRGKKAGVLMKMFPALRDNDGNRILVCHDCLQKMSEETKSIDG